MIANANSIRIPLSDKSVHMCVTSPPYWGLRDYQLPGTLWPAVTYTPMPGLAPITIPGCDPDCEHAWGEERRVTVGRGDHGTGCPTSHLGPDKDGLPGGTAIPRDASGGNWCQKCGGWRGCLGLEPTPEMFVAHIVAIFREVWRVLRDDATCWVNFGDSYASNPTSGGVQSAKMTGGEHKRTPQAQPYHRPPGLKPKDLCGIPWRVAFALQADGWYLRNDIIWHKPNPMPESVTDRCTKSHEYLFLLAKSKRYFYDAGAVREGNADPARTNYSPGSYTQSTGYLEVTGDNHRGFKDCDKYIGAGRNRRTVWTIPTTPYKGAHFATFPPTLVAPCILAGTSQKGVCSICGAPFERVVESKPYRPAIVSEGVRSVDLSRDDKTRKLNGKSKEWRQASASRETTGWHPTCDHGADPVPATVLDPFCGSGTTGEVCRETGRRSVLLDLSPHYLRDFALPRAEHKQSAASIAALPLFEL